ncbi:MAG TPA: dihydroxyacetone kinase subunit DhaL [Gemmatimonadales bacterium]|nr:dihydroxyacetone kinase subunit DhaL [Gemmatimonadales bacterium]
MKKLINDPRNVVREMLEGIVDIEPGLALLEGETVVLRSDLPEYNQRKVAVISGGGSGHEPAHAGYVGTGMLTAAVAGDVFTSPSVDAVLAAVRAVAGPAGVLLVVKNYTGDRLNFGLAAELAQQEGIPAEVVVVADDVALRGVVPPERRRGIAGTVLVHKVAGAAAEAGMPLAEVARLAQATAGALGTMGVALGAGTVPAAGTPGFTLGESEIELGLGIHGEKGVERTSLQPADHLVDTLLTAIVSDSHLAEGARVAVLVNGLGGTPPMELSIVMRRALGFLRGRGIMVERAWTGNFLTALEMPGCSISVLQLDDERLALIDAPAEAPAWKGPGRIELERRVVHLSTPASNASSPAIEPGPLAGTLKEAALAVAAAFEEAEGYLTDLDAQAGDGDLGASLARGAAAIRALPEGTWATPESTLSGLGNALRRAIGGSSGPFYATALLRAARHLTDDPTPDARAWSAAFGAGVGAVSDIGGAKVGDRTMVDALVPAREALSNSLTKGAKPDRAWAECIAAAEAGAAATATMIPTLGRASYLGERALGVRDAGAVAVTIWMKALAPFIGR